MKKFQLLTQYAQNWVSKTKKKARLNKFKVQKVFFKDKRLKNSYVLFYSKPRSLYKELRKLNNNTQEIFATKNRRGWNSILFISKFDVFITDRNGKILDVKENWKPNQVSEYYPDGYYLYFCVSGFVKRYKISKNNCFTIKSYHP